MARGDAGGRWRDGQGWAWHVAKQTDGDELVGGGRGMQRGQVDGSGMGGERYGMRRRRRMVDELVGGGSQHAMTQVDSGAVLRPRPFYLIF